MDCEAVIARLEALANPKAIEGMARFGITAKHIYGVSVPDLRKLAKEAGSDHQLAQELWAWDSRETRILASMIDDLKLVTEEQMESWAAGFDSWEVCDQCCMNLFGKTQFAREKCMEWSSREEEFVKRAAFALMACLAWKDKKMEDMQFEGFLPLLEKASTDNRNFVQKAVNWALRQIGKRNLTLNGKAIETATRIQMIDARSARWIASDAIRELTSEAVQERLRRKA